MALLEVSASDRAELNYELGGLVIILLLCAVVILLGGVNFLLGLAAIPVALLLGTYIAGLNGALFVLAMPILFPAVNILVALGMSFFKQGGSTPIPGGNADATRLGEEDRFKFGKKCNTCGEKVMNAAVTCPKCRARL